MQKISFQHYWARFFAILLLIVVGLPSARRAAAQTPNGYVFLVREMELSEIGIEGLEGLAYSPQADVLLAIQSEQNGVRPVALLDRTEELLGVSQIEGQPLDALNTAFNDETNSLFTVDPATQELTQTPLDPSGDLPTLATPAADPPARFNLSFGIQQARGMDIDPVSGRVFILDPAGKRLWIVTPDAAGNYDGDRAARENRVKRVNLSRIANGSLHGLAYNPNSGNLFALKETNDLLFEFTEKGDLVSTRDLSSLIELGSPTGMVFAPSGDMTDDPQTQSLYISDPSANSIAEFSITAVEVMALPAFSPVTLVNTIAAHAWDPPAPDTAGIAYNPLTNRLVVSDSEVDEMSIYEGSNVFLASLNGDLQSTCNTTTFGNKEPTGVAVNPANGSVFFSNDGQRALYEVLVGPDGQYCTGDDQVRTSNMRSYGSRDPEGIGFGDGKLFIADGTNAEVYSVAPGPNGFFNGAGTSGDDVVLGHFDTASLGLRDPEGIDYHPGRGTIFIVSRGDDLLVETTLTGQVLRIFDLKFLNAIDPAGVAVGPSSNNPSLFSIYIAARGLDNNDFPSENDGKIYELNVEVSGPTATPTNTPQPGLPVTFTTVGDAYVNANNPTRNFGNDISLRTDASPDIRSYLRFNVQGLTGPVVRATLRIFATNTTSVGYQVRGLSDNTWAESTINYNNAPALGSVIGSSGAVTINTWTTVDVTSYISGNGVFNLGLSTTGNTATTLASRETGANAPQLIVEIPVGSPPTSTPTPTPTLPPATPTPTNTPPAGTPVLFLSLASTGSGNLAFARDEDIVAFDGANFSQFFDGSDVGLSAANVDAFSIISSNSLLLSFVQPMTLPNIGQVDEFDIVQFDGTFGENTAGTFSLYLDGQDVGLDVASEDIDAINRLPNGILLISTSGGVSVPGVSGLDEDILAFTPTSLGDTTSGTWTLYFDGSDVGLATDSGEDIDGLSVANNGTIYLSTRGPFAVTGVSGTASDIFSCTPVMLGSTTNCTFSSSLFFAGANWGLSANNVDGFELNEP